jgi:hypothetical protein
MVESRKAVAWGALFLVLIGWHGRRQYSSLQVAPACYKVYSRSTLETLSDSNLSHSFSSAFIADTGWGGTQPSEGGLEAFRS